MGTIKLEFDIPEFEKELSISLTLKKDGEIVETGIISDSKKIEAEQINKPEVKTTSKKKAGNNLMGLEI